MKIPGLCTGLLIAMSACQSTPATSTENQSAPDSIQKASAIHPVSEAPRAQQDHDVLYYYRALKQPYAPPGYALKETNGRWHSASPDTGEALDATVDLKNGFIEIVDPGTGGGDWTYRVVLFRMANGEPVLGITHTFFDGAGLLHTYYFIRPEDPKQLDWTKYTIRAVSGFDFLPLDNAEEESIVKKLLPVSLELPRYGTSIKAVVYTGLKDIYCRGDENEYADYCGLFQQVRRREVTFKWNKETGKFVEQ